MSASDELILAYQWKEQPSSWHDDIPSFRIRECHSDMSDKEKEAYLNALKDWHTEGDYAFNISD